MVCVSKVKIVGAVRGKLTLDMPEVVIVSGWIREQNALGIEPLLTMEGEQQTLARGRPKIQDRAMLLLPVFAKRHGNINVPTFLEELVKDAMLFGVSYSATFDEVHALLRVLADDGFIDLGKGRVMLKSWGLLKAEEIGSKGGSGGQGFVAMSFSPALREAWTNAFDPAIRNAGYTPFRIDEKDFVGGITDEIIAEIRRSRFVVADYTEQKNGFYFEAGFALGLNLTVIQTAREDHIGNLHFDIKHLNTLPWKSPADLATKLERRIRAVVGAGPRAPWAGGP
jgi:hypothetical protein